MCETNDDVFMARYSVFNPYRMWNREMGFRNPIGYDDAIAKSLYCGMKATYCWSSTDPNSPTGGIFNLEFSPEGSLLVAACEKRTIQIFDPLNHNRIHCMVGAHQDCINCVKFLDSRMFATCSDDTTIALWDVRNLSKKIRSLVGHSKWVKNIEFSQKDKLLVTSGLDGSIYTWDINSYTEYNLVYQRVFHTSSLMRCRLSPDAKQMILSTTGGLIILINDLNLATLGRDMLGFKPNLYRLMQMSQQVIPVASKFDYLFDPDRKENRIEFISDFPGGNDAEVVSSLQIHPHGWTALSRNISHDDRSEWTCIHDIQVSDPSVKKSTRDRSPSPPPAAARRGRSALHPSFRINRRAQLGSILRRSPRLTLRNTPVAPSNPVDIPPRRSTRLQAGQHPAERDSESPRAEMELDAESSREESRDAVAGPSRSLTPTSDNIARIQVAHGASADAAASRLGRGIQNDLWEASITIKQHRILQDIFRRGSVRRSFNMQRITGVNTGIAAPPPRLRALPVALYRQTFNERPSLSGMTPERLSVEEKESLSEMKQSIRQNKERLLFYKEETNQGKGFIKELCYSADGRIVCSPFGRGIRMLAIDDNCSEVSQLIQNFEGPTEMREVGQSLGHHTDLVVCSKFNPRFHTLVSGCLEGKIVWYQPYSGEVLY